MFLWKEIKGQDTKNFDINLIEQHLMMCYSGKSGNLKRLHTFRDIESNKGSIN